ncbi:hypothetical protein [Streptomyces phaeochromogenes]|uniref:hypothetical protein n=1 Tax=Streptomyces phaeochromogenes TaxID=1923 RepID=UPI0006E30552|nr:hypothetical protein [Streptomyces phaeochromogenes]
MPVDALAECDGCSGRCGQYLVKAPQQFVSIVFTGERSAFDGVLKCGGDTALTVPEVLVSQHADPRLPDWAVHPLPEDSLELLAEWSQATDWPAAEGFLRTHANRLQQPGLRHDLDLAAALFPGDEAIDSLAAVLAEADSQGFDTVLDYGRRNHNARVLLQAWIDTSTWTGSRDFLDEHNSALRQPEIETLLADSHDPIARQHAAILELTAELPHDQVYEIVTNLDTATEHAFHAIDQADITFLRRILDAHTNPMTNAPGALFATVISLANNHTAEAGQLAKLIAQHATHVQRRAYAIHLRTLAQHNSELAPAEELADLIDPDNNS